jgi:hypothetical protein
MKRIKRYFLYRQVLRDLLRYRDESIVLYNQLKPLKDYLEEYPKQNPEIIDPLLASSSQSKSIRKSNIDSSPINRHVLPELNKLVSAEDLSKDLSKYGHKHTTVKFSKQEYDSYKISEMLKSTEKFKKFLEDNR